MQSLKLMILGLMVMLLGLAVVVDPASDLGGFEYLLMLVGFGIGLFAYQKREPQ